MERIPRGQFPGSKPATLCHLGHDDLEPLVEKNAYNLDVEAYIDWLDRGVEAFDK